MDAASTAAEYERRVNLALEYIQDHLDGDLSLREIARAACFSAYHFHRIFRAFTGETVAAYHRRLRLRRAAWQLLHRLERSVTEIALEAGFSSPSDFARSFRRQFAASPTGYRAGAAFREPREPAQDAYPPAWRRRVDAAASLVSLPELHLAYLRCKGLSRSFRSNSIREAYASLYRWAEERELLVHPVLPLGVYLDTPEVLAMEDCRYLACLAVADHTAPEGAVGVMAAGGGSFVTFPFRRSSPHFARSFFRTSLYLYRHWIPEHGYLPADSPVLEVYRLRGGLPTTLELHVPVEPCHRSPRQ